MGLCSFGKHGVKQKSVAEEESLSDVDLLLKELSTSDVSEYANPGCTFLISPSLAELLVADSAAAGPKPVSRQQVCQTCFNRFQAAERAKCGRMQLVSRPKAWP